MSRPPYRRRMRGRARHWLLRRLALLLLVVVGAAGAKLLWPAEAAQVYGGTPRAEAWVDRLTTHVLNNRGFVLGYSERRGAPLWVSYRVADPAAGRHHPRPEQFSVDARTLRRVDSGDYRGSGYDRGHMAPNYLISRLHGPQAQRQTFRMSNIVPQTQRLNQLLWQRLEELEADVLARRHPRLWVMMGPIYGERAERIGGLVPVPEAFYRLWLREDAQGRPQALALIVPQQVCGDERLTDFVVPVAEVEQRAGLDFLHALPPEEELRLASVVALQAWPALRSAGTRARYGDRFDGRPCPWR